MSESVISTIAGSGVFRMRTPGRRGGHDEAEDLDDSDEESDAGAFKGLDERARGGAFFFTGLRFSILVTCSVGVACSVRIACSVRVACSVRIIDSSGACDDSVPLALVAFFLVVVTTGAGGSSLKIHWPSSPILRVYQFGVSLTLSSLAIVRNCLYSCSPQCASFAASNSNNASGPALQL